MLMESSALLFSVGMTLASPTSSSPAVRASPITTSLSPWDIEGAQGTSVATIDHTQDGLHIYDLDVNRWRGTDSKRFQTKELLVQFMPRLSVLACRCLVVCLLRRSAFDCVCVCVFVGVSVYM